MRRAHAPSGRHRGVHDSGQVWAALAPAGTGKSHLAIAISIRACLAGQRVAFATATEWVAKLGEAKRQGGLEDRCVPIRDLKALGR
jgi:DNA replication protein DnaC